MEIDSGNTAWILTSAALVLLMTPGLAFFYGGMSRAKSVLNMMMMSFVSMSIVSMVWVLWGYSVAFGEGGVPAFFGGLDALGLVGLEAEGEGYPSLAFVAFQATFAIITVALISGAVADRTKFMTWCVFVPLWLTLVYLPICHWVWHAEGWIFKLGAIDFAGGTVVHINAGCAALALALVLGRRKGWPKEPMRPHNLPFVLLGAGLLWFGWFGFNGGSALAANESAALAFVNTLVATGAAGFAWIMVEKLRDGAATTLGIASGIVAGLVAITPAAASMTPLGALVLGLVAGAVCAVAVGLKYRLGYDDSLDVVGVHLVGGIIGALAIGVFGSLAGTVPAASLLSDGSAVLLGKQAAAIGATMAYSFIVTFILGKVLDMTMGFRVDEEAEATGIDIAEHAESAYDLNTSSTGGLGGPTAAPIAGDIKKVEADA
ncbi:ammonium transporter [Actinocorallia populi]|uniref:ammonium transporter n=1 Tax=Actinocorallia populi TaxID=2079200 RepID=UPI000D08ECE1|nr:ammonium transporter [Actinocorallia populi]